LEPMAECHVLENQWVIWFIVNSVSGWSFPQTEVSRRLADTQLPSCPAPQWPASVVQCGWWHEPWRKGSRQCSQFSCDKFYPWGASSSVAGSNASVM
jgi:hypothetical protein